jgi:very-short-patch-repair endonuclease
VIVPNQSLPKILRRQPTLAEVRFWRLIHPLRQSWHFRKQAPIGRYVVDFACHSARLIVEIDGDSHYTAAGIAHDGERSAFLAGEGYRVLRFTNREVMDNAEGVYLAVEQALGASGPHPLPASPIKGEV